MKIICKNCKWNWELSEGGNDPYTCHKCGGVGVDSLGFLKEKYNNIRFEIYDNEKNKTLFLTGFIVPIKLRNSGIGTQFMKDLTYVADINGYKIILSPSNSYGGNLNRLKEFYKRFGFVKNKGQNRDFSHKEDMYREPIKNIEDINEEIKRIITIIEHEKSHKNFYNKEKSLNENRSDYLKWKRKNVTIRGVKEIGIENSGGAMLGRGLYTAFLSNRDLAKQYGEVHFLINALPKNPKVFNTLNDWEIWFYNTLVYKYSKENGKEFPDIRDFNKNTTIENELIKMGYDGIIIKGREIVNFTPPDNVIYFKNEKQLENYYDTVIKSSSE